VISIQLGYINGNLPRMLSLEARGVNYSRTSNHILDNSFYLLHTWGFERRKRKEKKGSEKNSRKQENKKTRKDKKA
jgi:hypothetical protein